MVTTLIATAANVEMLTVVMHVEIFEKNAAVVAVAGFVVVHECAVEEEVALVVSLEVKRVAEMIFALVVAALAATLVAVVVDRNSLASDVGIAQPKRKATEKFH